MAAAEVQVEGTLVVDGIGTLFLRAYDKGSPGDANLALKDPSGGLKWEAPQVQVQDKWVAVSADEGRIFGTSFGGWRCELDPSDGRILSSTFVK